MSVVPLAQAESLELHGGKAVQLGQAIRAGLPVPPGLALPVSFVDAQLAQLEQLTQRCEAVFDGAHDIEWAFEGRQLYLLQRRAVTR